MDLNEQECELSGKLKTIPMQQQCSKSIGPTSSDTETSGPLIGAPLNLLMYCVVDSPAKILASPVSVQGLMEHGPGCGVNMSEPFAHFDHDTSSWRTFQASLLTNTWDEFLETWPRAGMMQNGIVSRVTTSAPRKSEIECGLLPTVRKVVPTSIPADRYFGEENYHSNLEEYLGGHPSPTFAEELMGYPMGWTELGAVGMQLSRKLQKR